MLQIIPELIQTGTALASLILAIIVYYKSTRGDGKK